MEKEFGSIIHKISQMNEKVFFENKNLVLSFFAIHSLLRLNKMAIPSPNKSLRINEKEIKYKHEIILMRELKQQCALKFLFSNKFYICI